MLRPLLLAAVAAVAAQAHAQGAARPGPIEVVRPWSRPAVAGFNGVGYMTLVNRGRTPAVLVKVETPIARTVEMHRSQMSGGVMSMAPAPRIDVPAGGSVVFAPGGYHLMFIGLKKTLKPGDAIPATLSFAGGRRVSVAFQVTSGEPPPERPVGHSDAGR